MFRQPFKPFQQLNRGFPQRQFITPINNRANSIPQFVNSYQRHPICQTVIPKRFCSATPNNYYFTETHEWLKPLEDNQVKIGLTNYAQELIGEIVFASFTDIDRRVNRGDEIANFESIKAIANTESPIDGVVKDVNPRIIEKPYRINSDPYGDGWIMIIQPDKPFDPKGFMDKEKYDEYTNHL